MKKERSYRRMNWTVRVKLEALFNAGHTYRFIAKELGFSCGSVYVEVQHGLYER